MKRLDNEDWLEDVIDLDVSVHGKIHRMEKDRINFISSSFELLAEDRWEVSKCQDYSQITTEGYEAFARQPISFKIHSCQDSL